MKRKHVPWALGWLVTVFVCLAVISTAGCKKEEKPKTPETPAPETPTTPAEEPETPTEEPTTPPEETQPPAEDVTPPTEEPKAPTEEPEPPKGEPTAPQGQNTRSIGAAAEATTVVVNSRCPILGRPIDRQNVPVSLTRTFRGQKVGFCCAACLPQWDDLTDEQKAAKLEAAMTETASPTT